MANTYPTYLFRDPLLANHRMNNNREGTPLTLHNNIDINVEGDFLLKNYIKRLDKEILGKMPDGMSGLAEVMWTADDWKQLAPRFMDESRKHGWCVVQFYKEQPSNPYRWQVFSVQRFTDYIRETYTDEEGKSHTVAKGIKFEWGDYLGNSFKEELMFADELTFLIKFEEGDGKSVFAFPDLSQDIMTLAFEFRQIKGQMNFASAKPSFLWFAYGDACIDAKATELDNKLKGIDSTSAIGANKKILEDITNIENTNLKVIEPAYEKQLQLYAGATRLPVSYYMGERQSSGMSDMGEKSELLKIQRKKETLFLLYKPHIEEMFKILYKVDLDISLPQEESLEVVEEEDNGQENKKSNKREKSK